MKRLALFLIIAAVLVAAPVALSVPPDFFVHSISVSSSIASLAIAAPSYTINEWCQLRRYSRAEFYRMQFRGDGPDTIGKGRMRRITPGADAKWLRAQERKSRQSNKAT